MSSADALEMLKKWSTARTALEFIVPVGSPVGHFDRSIVRITSVTPVALMLSSDAGDITLDVRDASFDGTTPTEVPDDPSAASLEITFSDGRRVVLSEEVPLKS